MKGDKIEKLKRKRKPKRKRQAPIKKQVLTWMRGKRRDTTLSHRMIWESHCRRYRIEEISIQLALDTNPYPTYYLALHGNTLLKRNKRRSAAEDTCERHVQGLMR
jgi:hypothetical protein